MNMCRDGFHLLSEGSKIVVKEILMVLKEANWEPSLYWLSMPNEFADDLPYYTVRRDGKSSSNPSNLISRWKREWMMNSIKSKL